eukprot:TRINITY_DN17145_c0_g1_i1.p1 TRINITY_DN17145_c0_g1~~TRINITY_DN17145_c0_g1_i1.p1  ORF type:complete len:110 (-),score=9.91 TRINITY_DN17145_c0_g1_i1:71-400(-)
MTCSSASFLARPCCAGLSDALAHGKSTLSLCKVQALKEIKHSCLPDHISCGQKHKHRRRPASVGLTGCFFAECRFPAAGAGTHRCWQWAVTNTLLLKVQRAACPPLFTL